ncbi:MAG: glutamate-5-semialdehyde dehydrogenase [Methylophilaceae bacterium]
MNIKDYILSLGQEARSASRQIASATTVQKNNFLSYLAEEVIGNKDEIIRHNKIDLDNAKKGGLDAAFIDRLTLNDKNIQLMADGLNQIEALNDPIGEIINLKYRPTGIQVGQMRVPLGVIGMIYESRPNVTIDAAGLAIKSSNAIILRGGSESINSNNYLSSLIKKSLLKSGLPEASVQIIELTDREAVTELIQLGEYIDVIVPRGGKSLIKKITDEAKVPVIKHLDGNCHIYVDNNADLDMALNVVDNAKTQRLGTCNTLESLVIHKDIAQAFLSKIDKIFNEKNIEIRACQKSLSFLSNAKKASDDDFATEYLGPTISCKIVDTLEAGISHINQYSSGHTEAIITNNHANAMRFLREVDSSSVMINASTRFADGFEYGLGAEIGISTDKFHARGPVGLEGLTSLKYIVLGTGQTRK